jgi:hypothetical protein
MCRSTASSVSKPYNAAAVLKQIATRCPARRSTPRSRVRPSGSSRLYTPGQTFQLAMLNASVELASAEKGEQLSGAGHPALCGEKTVEIAGHGHDRRTIDARTPTAATKMWMKRGLGMHASPRACENS